MTIGKTRARAPRDAQAGTAPEREASRVVIERVRPEIDAGRFPVKRAAGDRFVVEADVFAEGHDLLACALRHRKDDGATPWSEAPMESLPNDLWRGSFVVSEIGRYRYTVVAWVDAFKSWRRDFAKRVEAGQELGVHLQIGAGLVAEAARRAEGTDARQLEAWARALRQCATGAVDLVLGEELLQLQARYPDRSQATSYSRELVVTVGPVRARFSTWYELFPRSCGESGRHGTLRDVEAQLPRLSDMGFDVLYLPPIHPIGRTKRKGRNNAVVAAPGDPGSPWGIGAAEGGHKAVHPELGTIADFRRLVARARELGIEVALDIAFQCSPDHPYVTEHPEWFRHRPDGTVQFAENPPKKYEDIYPIDFESSDWRALWEELRDVVQFWADQGVTVFRVDNPHTKPMRFWEWLIGDIQSRHPETIFLAEAFTRPKIMYHLAKLGFSQSYTYFAWRNTKWELTQYFTELTQTEVREFFRPNLWPNTPDILTEYLQFGGRPAFLARLVLAGTLGASYGIYGPAYEAGEHLPREPRSEEYLDSEKYEIRRWSLDGPHGMRDFITRVNRIRRENPALQTDRNLRFHPVDNEQLICYSKSTDDLGNIVLVVVNLDPHHTQSGWVELPLADLKIDPHQPFQVHDMLSDARYLWNGLHNYVELAPGASPAHIFRVRRRLRSEHDFDYYQ